MSTFQWLTDQTNFKGHLNGWVKPDNGSKKIYINSCYRIVKFPDEFYAATISNRNFTKRIQFILDQEHELIRFLYLTKIIIGYDITLESLIDYLDGSFYIE